MPIGEVYQLAVDQSLHGVLVTNIFYYNMLVDGAGPDEEQLFDAFKEDAIPTWRDACTSQWSVTCLRARRVSGVGTFPESLEVITGSAGTILEEALPANCVAVCSWYSQTYTKTGRGRSYFSGGPLSGEDTNTWQAAQMTLWNAIAAILQGTITDSVSAGSFERTLWSGTPPAKRDVVKREMRPQVRKLRSRTTRACVTA